MSREQVKELTETAAYDYGTKNIRINAIAPRSIETPIYKDYPDLKKQLEEMMLFKRLEKQMKLPMSQPF